MKKIRAEWSVQIWLVCILSENVIIEDEVTKEFILEIAGDEALDIIEQLKEKGETTDEDIAENVECDLNNVRKILYKLYDNGLADYSRSRDEKSGWITYSWELTLDNIDSVLKERKKVYLEELEERLEYEENNVFYVCPDGHERLTFEEASEEQFECPECGKQMVHYDDDRDIKEIKETIEELKEDLENS
ncbi:transcription factor E [archaeon SCG-AAA382B04]|nr:transcription factor E [archaeon SCG-AAA382B04]